MASSKRLRRRVADVSAASPPLFLALVGLLGAGLLRIAAAQATSSIFTNVHLCMLSGGKVDLYTPYIAVEPKCLYTCPPDAEEVYRSCVRERSPGSFQEIALTLHVPCNLCAADKGVTLASELWIGVARALKVPLQEIVASVLVVSSGMRSQAPLEHFTLQRLGEAPLLAPGGSELQGSMARWDLFLAIRVHTSRVPPGDTGLQALVNGQSWPVSQLMGVTDTIYVFEAERRLRDEAFGMENIRATYKIRGLPWDTEPGGATSPSAAPATTSALRGATTTAVETQSTSLEATAKLTTVPQRLYLVGCSCQSSWLADGYCDQVCNNDACEYDGGDCGGGKTTTSAGLQPQGQPASLSIVETGSEKDYNLRGFVGDYYHNPLPSNADVYTHSEGVTDVYWRADHSLWRFGPRVCADIASPTFGCGSWFVEVADGARQMYSSNLVGNGLALTWHQASSSTTSAPEATGRRTTSTTTAPSALLGQKSLTSLRVQSAEDAEDLSWRVVATNSEQGSWYVDAESRAREEESGITELHPALIGFLVFVALIMLLGICCLARRGSRIEPTEVLEYTDSEESVDAERQFSKQGRSPTKDTVHSRSTSTVSDDSDASEADEVSGSWASSPHSDGRLRGSAAAGDERRSPFGTKEPKVYPEPEPGDDIGKFMGTRNARGGWRMGGPMRSRSEGAGGSAPRSEARRHTADLRGAASPPRRGGSAFSNIGARDARQSANAAAWDSKVDAKERQRQQEVKEKQAENERRRKDEELREAEEERRRSAKMAAEAEQRRQKAREAAQKRREAEERKQAQKWCQEEKRRQQSEKRQRSASAGPPPPRGEAPPGQPKAAGRGKAPGPDIGGKSKASSSPTSKFSFFGAWGGGSKSGGSKSGGGSSATGSSSSGGAGARSASAPPRPSPSSAPQSNAAGVGKGAAPEPEQLAAPLVAEMQRKLDQNRKEPLDVRKKVFKDLQRQLHPDKNLDNPDGAKLAFQKLQENRGWFLLP